MSSSPVRLPLAADDLETLAGKWSVKKVNDQGQDYTQTIAIKKDKFVFQITGAEDRVVLYAEGDLKLDKLGPFNAAHFVNIRAGGSASDLQDVDEQYVSIYRLESDTWTMAANFDKERENRSPAWTFTGASRRPWNRRPWSLTKSRWRIRRKVRSGSWFEAKVEGVTRTYHVEGKGYDKNQVKIPVALELPAFVRVKNAVSRSNSMILDEDASTEEADNRSHRRVYGQGKGKQTYKPEDNWRYTVRWHLK